MSTNRLNGRHRGQPKLAARDPATIERQIEEIEQLDLASLRQRWAEVYGSAPPRGLYRELLARALAYRIQAEAFGDLDTATKKLLAELAKGDESVLDPARPPLKPGTILVREWNKQLHRVTVLSDGFAWNGNVYTSLSACARAISGTNWNGYKFFDLRTRRPPREPGDA